MEKIVDCRYIIRIGVLFSRICFRNWKIAYGNEYLRVKIRYSLFRPKKPNLYNTYKQYTIYTTSNNLYTKRVYSRR